MSTLLRMLEPSDDRSESKDKPIIIIVDEFDLFALHPRQSFLYCLLDIVQGNRRKGGMGVIGISARTVSSSSILGE
jgi:Cdc6-like AAA superfamily ATPase